MSHNNEHRAAMAELVKKAASALYQVQTYWEANHLPGDFSTPETGYPFQLSLDDVVADVWHWADELMAPAPEPTSEQLDTWAHDIMGAIVDDIAEHRIPLGIRTFSDLHSYVDANEYLLATPCPWGSDAATQDDDCGVRHHNALTERVEILLLATADMLAYDLKLKCTNEQHQHIDERDPQDRPLDYVVPMVCHHCHLPTHWDDTLGWYQHDELGHPCWRLDDDDKRTPCTPDYDEVDLDLMVDILKRLGIPAFTEMTGGGTATLYAGKVVGTNELMGDAPKYQACAGPGWFEGPYYSLPRVSFAEFYIGPDGDDFVDDPTPKSFVDAIQRIVALCK